MIESPTENVQLTFEQLQQIETAKKMLSRLESEILNAQNILKGTKMECDRAVKDFDYRQTLLSEIEPKIATAKNTLTDFEQQISEAKITLEKCQKETRLLNETNVLKDQELRNRANILSLSEVEHQKKVEEHSVKLKELSDEKFLVKSAKDAFLKAIETVKWSN